MRSTFRRVLGPELPATLVIQVTRKWPPTKFGIKKARINPGFFLSSSEADIS